MSKTEGWNWPLIFVLVHVVETYLSEGDSVVWFQGYVVRPCGPRGSHLGFLSVTDPRGKLPPWLVNRATHLVGPKVPKAFSSKLSLF